MLSTRLKIGLAVIASVAVIGAGVTYGAFFANPTAAQQGDDPGEPMAARTDMRPVDTLTVGGRSVPVISRVEVETSSAGPTEFLLKENNTPVLERGVAKADAGADGKYHVELGALMLQSGDRLELSMADPSQARGVKLKVTPYSDAEAKADHTAELRASHALVFQDDFNSLNSTPDSAGGLWSTSLKRGQRIHESSPESLYSDETFSRSVGAGAAMNPYSVNNGILSIKAGQIPQSAMTQVRDAMRAKLTDGPSDALRYYSGSLSSHSSWSQTYGYFEMRAKLPRGEGFWPAFWLTASVGWPPEIDVLEAIYHAKSGAGVNMVHSALHYKHLGADGRPVAPRLAMAVNNPAQSSTSMYDGFHLYAAEWTPQWVSVYFDGRLTYKAPTPQQRRSPMVLLANLQVGTKNPQPRWAAHLADQSDLAHTMDIDFIADYRSTGAYPSLRPGADGSITATAPQYPAAGWTLEGDDRPNRIDTGDEIDIIRTGAGADTVVIRDALDAHKIIEDFNPAQGDRLELTQFPFGTAQEALAAARQVGPDVWIMAGARPIAPQTIILRGLRLAQLPASALLVSDPAKRPPRDEDDKRPAAKPKPERPQRRDPADRPLRVPKEPRFPRF